MSCFVLCGKVVTPINESSSESGEVKFHVVTAENLPTFPARAKKLGLIPYPHGTTPSIIVEERKICKAWGGPLLIMFFIYDTQFDSSQFIGGIYSVQECAL
jgi:hypothetical protein